MYRLDVWIASALVAAALALAGLLGARVMAFRTLEPFEGPVTGREPFAAFRGRVERCDLARHRLYVGGWIARAGAPRARHATRVLLRDAADGRFWQLPTDRPARLDVTARLARELNDGVDYTTSGFAASVDLRKSSPRIDGGRVFIAYDAGGARAGLGYILVPTRCVVTPA